MSQAHPFHIEAFLLDNGTIDTTRYMLKIARSSIHPGVISAFLTEAIGQDTTVADSKLAHGYVRGSRAHAWILPADKVPAFNDYLSKFNVMSLVNHFKALRAKMPAKTAKPAKTVLYSVPMTEDADDDGDDSYDPETDSDLD